MDTHITAGPLPSFKRYKSLFLNGNGESITRALQYEQLRRKTFFGKMLDFGGGEKAKYRPLLSVESCESMNIDPAMAPTWVTGVGEPLPCPDAQYDTVLSLNTFEHIYDVQPVIREIRRVLKPGGEFVCALPFLYPVHAHPDDFFRPTASWWVRTLSDAGFADIRITPLLWGPFSTGAVCSGLPGPFRTIRKHISLLLDLLYVRLRFGHREMHFTGPAGAGLHNHALGYFIEAG